VPQKIIIDTDPGQDDAVAILMALASPELDVLGIVTVGGNVPLPRTTLNARRIRELAGRADVPIHAGCSRPLSRPLVTAEHVHGPTGLDGPHFPDPVLPVGEMHGVDWLVATLKAAAPGSITLCILGPMTNLAMALVKEPSIAGAIDRVIAMGGAYFEVGNITPAAEFNIYVDPEAAHVVLSSGIPVTLAPLDLTHKILVTKQRFERILAVGTAASPRRRRNAEVLRAVRREQVRLGRRPHSRPLRHRPPAAARAVFRAPHQRRDRDRQRTHPRHDRRGLVARDEAPSELPVPEGCRRRRVLRPAGRVAGGLFALRIDSRFHRPGRRAGRSK
jgi:inosine-uridine nucleoside N-ribohydrolase